MNTRREIPSYKVKFDPQTRARTDQAAKHAKEKQRMTSPSGQYHFISAEDSFMTFIVPSYRATRPRSRHYPYILMDSQLLHL
jgi:hypothetical protein